MQITIIKYEPYPREFSTGMAVGYNIRTKAGRNFYIDVIVDNENNTKTDEEILKEAWLLVENEVALKVAELESRHGIVGTVWNPSSKAIEEPEEPIGSEI